MVVVRMSGDYEDVVVVRMSDGMLVRHISKTTYPPLVAGISVMIAMAGGLLQLR